VAAEVALALLLLVGATLTIRSLSRLQEVNPGFNPASVLTANILLPRSSYAEPTRRASFFKTLLERVTAMPGVESAGMVSSLPFGGSKSGQDIFYAEGAAPLHPGDRPIAFVRTIDPAYFQTLQVRLIRGSFFTPHDSSGPPVAIVNETLARRLWPNQDPIGRRFGGSKPDAWLKVVGVIADMRNTSLADPPDFEFFIPHERLPGPAMSLVVRTARDPMSLASTLRAAVRELDKDLPLSNVTTLEESISRSTGVRRLSVALLGVFALLALLLAAVGIYGVVSYSVTLRTHEIGLRMALGAAPGRIAGMIVGQAVLLGAAGVAAGIAGSLGLTRLLGSMLYGVSATDPAVFAAASFFLLAISALSAYLPARRASRVDPLVALRHE
jgi:putative ABC transport system permease protein